MVPRPPPDTPPKRCADCPKVLPDPRATRCAEHSAARRRALRPAVNADHYARNRLLVETALNAYEDGGAAWITTEAARRLAAAGDALTDAVAGLDAAVNDPPFPGDPTGEIRIRFARIHLRNKAHETARLLTQVTRDLTDRAVTGAAPPPPGPGAS